MEEVAIGWFLGTGDNFGQRIPVVEASPASAPSAHGALLLIPQRKTVVVDEERAEGSGMVDRQDVVLTE